MTESANVFDEFASHYDASFTNTIIGSLMRQAVWRRIDTRFDSGDRILELNCGTGEDAIHLASRGVKVLATDASVAMIDVAREKIERAGVPDLVQLRRLAIEECDERRGAELKDAAGAPAGFDGILSNFGGLNCVEDLSRVGTALAHYVRPGGVVVFCVMGPVVPWEWLWYTARGRVGRAWRRFGRDGASWRGITVRYPSIRTVQRAFAPAFRPIRVSAIGALLPPPYTEGLTGKFPRLLRVADRWERRLENVFPLPWLADHYLIEMVRR